MLRTITNAMVYEMGELKVKENNGREIKYINFKIGTRRSTRRTVTDKNGNTKKEYINDYMYCMAFGTTAQTLNDYCNNYDEEGNFIPRLVYLEGKVENYTYEKEFTIEATGTLDGKTFPVIVKKKLPQYGCRLIVDQMMFMDAPPENTRKSQDGEAVVVVASKVTDDMDIDQSKVLTGTVVKDNSTKDKVDEGTPEEEGAISKTDSDSDSKTKGGKSSKNNKKSTSKTKGGKSSKDDKDSDSKPKIKTKEILDDENSIDETSTDDMTPGIAGLFDNE